MLHVLIAFTVVVAALDVAETGERREVIAQRMTLEARQQHLRQLFNTGFVFRVTDVDNLPVAAAVFVLDNAEQRFNTIANIGEAAFLFTAFDKLDRRTFNQVQDQLSNRTRAADTCGIQVIQTRAPSS